MGPASHGQRCYRTQSDQDSASDLHECPPCLGLDPHSGDKGDYEGRPIRGTRGG